MNIQEQLKTAIADSHAAAESSTVNARDKMQDAINKRVMCASLVEKAQQMHKQDLAGYLSGTLTGPQIKAYLSLHDASQKRGALHDKRQLLLCGILEQGEPTNLHAAPKPPPSIISSASTFTGRFNKVLERRPVDEWQPSEREQVKDVLQPIVDFYNNL
jgi:hypothetical protein